MDLEISVELVDKVANKLQGLTGIVLAAEQEIGKLEGADTALQYIRQIDEVVNAICADIHVAHKQIQQARYGKRK